MTACIGTPFESKEGVREEALFLSLGTKGSFFPGRGGSEFSQDWTHHVYV